MYKNFLYYYYKNEYKNIFRLMKDLQNLINEARQINYRVAFVDCVDSEGLPIAVSILVDSKDVDVFEKFLNDQEGNLFVHAGGGNVEY